MDTYEEVNDEFPDDTSTDMMEHCVNKKFDDKKR